MIQKQVKRKTRKRYAKRPIEERWTDGTITRWTPKTGRIIKKEGKEKRGASGRKPPLKTI